MAILDLYVEQFGLWSDLRLAGFCGSLNVIHGHSGPDKLAMMQFVRWLLYGTRPGADRRYTSAMSTPASGSMTVLQDGRKWTITRRDDGISPSRLSVEPADTGVSTQDQVRRLSCGVDEATFDRIFALSLGEPVDMSGLVRHAQSQGFDFTGRTQSHPQRAMLIARLEEAQRERERLGLTLERREHLRARAEQLRDELRRLHDVSRREADHELLARRDLDREISLLEEDIERDRQDLQEIEAKIARRRTRLADVRQALRQAESWEVERRATRLRQFEIYQQRWRVALEEIRACIHQWETDPTWNQDSRPSLRYWSEIGYGFDSLNSAWQAPRNWREAGRLETDGHAEEWRQLRHCEAALQQLVEGAARRVNEYRQDLEAARRGELHFYPEGERGPLSLNALVERYLDHHDAIPRLIGVNRTHLNLVSGSVRYDDMQRADDLTDERWLGQLIRQRQSILDELDDMERSLRVLLDRRGEWMGSRGRLDVSRVDVVNRELHEVERLLAHTDDLDRLSREIESLQRELSALQPESNQSTVMQEASHWLSRMTRGRFNAMTIDRDTVAWVQEAHGQSLMLDNAGLGTRQRAYLALCMALVRAYRQRGVDLPMIVSDAFINGDSESARHMAEALNDFAVQNNPLILLTGYEDALQLFPGQDVRYFDLEQYNRQLQYRERRPTGEVAATSRSKEFQPMSRTHSHPVWDDAVARRAERPRAVEPTNTHDREPLTSERTPRRRSQASAREVSPGGPVYYVHPNDPVADAPSIGPRSAERLAEVAIYTVGDFLAADADQLASRLKYRRITGETIRQWQAQALLVCSVPELRGLDAQLLVACDVLRPEQLADADSVDLDRRVQAYLNTNEGKRLVRGSKVPDSARVASWIQRAQISRSHRAA